ncbi:Gibberellin 2-beta-dioxygenase 8 [Linum grandiflorum]
MEEIDPPFHEAYNYLFETARRQAEEEHHSADIVEACELPVIDLARLTGLEREECVAEMVRASEEWGFFQVVNHGISREILDQMRHEQMKVFHQPFVKKREEVDKFSPGTYRWGTPTATCLKQLAWSEAFHIPMTDISASQSANRSFNSLRYNSSLPVHSIRGCHVGQEHTLRVITNGTRLWRSSRPRWRTWRRNWRRYWQRIWEGNRASSKTSV